MADFLDTNQLAILRWLHIIAMVYWLGGEWGVFQTSYKVVNPALSFDERRRHMDTAFRIDILARMGIITLLPLGLHMGHIWGVLPYGERSRLAHFPIAEQSGAIFFPISRTGRAISSFRRSSSRRPHR